MAPELSDSYGIDGDCEDGLDEPSFDDPDDFVDDISEEELLGDILNSRPKEAGGFDSIIVVDGMPKVAKDDKKSTQKSLFDKLHGVIRKIFDRFGAITNEEWPVDQSGLTKGYAFFEYKKAEYAVEAIKRANMHRLDKAHTLVVNSFTDFEKYVTMEDDWKPPEPQPYPDFGNMQQFLQDAEAFDEYVILSEAGEKTSIYKNSMPEPTLVEERKLWTEKYVKWSPKGTYLATMHSRGVALWGGPTFRQIMRFHHPRVEFIDFSPSENYLVTFSPVMDIHGDTSQSVIVWDVRTGKTKRSFSVDRRQIVSWPVLKWSFDDRYFARQQRVERKDGVVDMISIFETPSCGLLDKKSIEVPGVQDFCWSPTDNVLAYWVGEVSYGAVPARVTLIKIPSREVLRAKNLFSVVELKLHWQRNGDHLCVKVDRYTRVKKDKDEQTKSKFVGVYYNFEVFHVRVKNVPVDSIELKEKAIAFSWEPVGSRFAVVTVGPSSVSHNVSIYSAKDGAEPSLLKKFEKKMCSHLFWSPRGQHLVLAELNSMNGMLEFVDANDLTIMGAGEHFMCTDVEWDKSGRYVITAVNWWAHKVDNAYWLWTCQGRVVLKRTVDRLINVQWRPRPRSLLSDKQVKNIKKNLQKYSDQFDVKDKMRASRASKELIEKRQRLMREFSEYRADRINTWNEQREQRLELRNGVDCDSLTSNAADMEEETIEMIVKKEVTVVE